MLFLIRSLINHGAERQLVELVKALNKDRFEATVVTFYDENPLSSEIEDLPGVRVVSLGKRSHWDLRPFGPALYRVARRERPDIIHGYLETANLLSIPLSRALRCRAIWGIRIADPGVPFRAWSLADRVIFKLDAVISRFAHAIILNADASRRYMIAEGFRPDRMRVIHNGIDTERFKPDTVARKQIRREWGLDDDKIAIGLAARVHRVKDHRGFLEAASILSRRRDDVRFVCAGRGTDEEWDELRNYAASLSLGGRVIWLGNQPDMVSVYNGLDVLASSSIGESFSNSIAEAMACGVPCAATNVGDSAVLVGETGLVVEPRDPEAMCDAWVTLLEGDRAGLGRAARARIVSEFGVQPLARRTEAVFEAII
ncbi:MAG: glycosyltransferase [Chloroflexota bacterium]